MQPVRQLWSFRHPPKLAFPVHSVLQLHECLASTALHSPISPLWLIHRAKAFTMAWARGCLRAGLAQIKHANAPDLLARNSSWPGNESTDCRGGGGDCGFSLQSSCKRFLGVSFFSGVRTMCTPIDSPGFGGVRDSVVGCLADPRVQIQYSIAEKNKVVN